MTLQECRDRIDKIDPKIRELLMERMDCAYHVAEAKAAQGSADIFRADREAEILRRLGEGVPEDRKAGYLAVVRKIMETSRMYQYGLLYDWMEDAFAPLAEGLLILPGDARVRIRLSLPNRPGSMARILSMIGDYGFDLEKMELTGYSEDHGEVTFALTILGDLSRTHMKKLMFQLSRESRDFRILENLPISS